MKTRAPSRPCYLERTEDTRGSIKARKAIVSAR
jgi:hypothetical protein